MEVVSIVFILMLIAFAIGYVMGGEIEYKKNLAAKDPYIYHDKTGWWVKDCPFKEAYPTREKARSHARYHRITKLQAAQETKAFVKGLKRRNGA